MICRPRPCRPPPGTCTRRRTCPSRRPRTPRRSGRADDEDDRAVLGGHRGADGRRRDEDERPGGRVRVSSPTTNLARPRTTAYSSSLPLSSSCGGISCPPASAFQALTPAARKPSVYRTGMRLLPRCSRGLDLVEREDLVAVAHPLPLAERRARRGRSRPRRRPAPRGSRLRPSLRASRGRPGEALVDLRAQLALEREPLLARASPRTDGGGGRRCGAAPRSGARDPRRGGRRGCRRAPA